MFPQACLRQFSCLQSAYQSSTSYRALKWPNFFFWRTNWLTKLTDKAIYWGSMLPKTPNTPPSLQISSSLLPLKPLKTTLEALKHSEGHFYPQTGVEFLHWERGAKEFTHGMRTNIFTHWRGANISCWRCWCWWWCWGEGQGCEWSKANFVATISSFQVLWFEGATRDLTF